MVWLCTAQCHEKQAQFQWIRGSKTLAASKNLYDGCLSMYCCIVEETEANLLTEFKWFLNGLLRQSYTNLNSITCTLRNSEVMPGRDTRDVTQQRLQLT